MRRISILVIALGFISCEDSEKIYAYPDGITKPNTITKSRGCGNIFVYQFIDSLRALTVSIDPKEFSFTKKRQDVYITDSNPNLSVILEIAGNDPDSIYFNYCNDVAYPNRGITTRYKAVSGKLSFSVSEDNPIKDPVWESSYRVTIKIENLHLSNHDSNKEIVFEEVVFWDVYVGWLPG